MRQFLLGSLAATAVAYTGCAGLPTGGVDSAAPRYAAGQAPGDEKGDRDKKEKEKDEPKEPPKPPKALFEWAIGPQEEKDKEDAKGEPEKEKPIDTDRPDFGVATTTPGKGRAVLETGYSFYHDRGPDGTLTGHTYPDAVLRLGMFTDWFEFRVGQTFANIRTTPVASGNVPAPQTPADRSGAQDLYLGTKFALTEQKGFLPESVLLLQGTVPSGSRDLTNNRVLPGIIYSYGWDVIEEKLTVSGLTEADKVFDGVDNTYTQLAQTVEARYSWTPKFRTFIELLALMPVNATAPGIGPQYYAHPGMCYLVTDNLQLDFHVFIGLNRHATDYFGGPGLSVRY